MQRTQLISLIILLLVGVAGAQNCGVQGFAKMDDVDPNQVVIDPVSSQRLLVQFVRAKVNTTVTIRGTACDDDGDPMIVWRDVQGEQLPVDPNTGVFTFEVAANAPGIVYTAIGVTDGTDTRMGTYAVEFYQNSAPVLGYVPVKPTPVGKAKQKLLMVWHKYTGMPLTSGFAFRVKNNDVQTD